MPEPLINCAVSVALDPGQKPPAGDDTIVTVGNTIASTLMLVDADAQLLLSTTTTVYVPAASDANVALACGVPPLSENETYEPLPPLGVTTIEPVDDDGQLA